MRESRRIVAVIVAVVVALLPAAAHAAPEWRSMTGGVGWDPCDAVILRPNPSPGTGAYAGFLTDLATATNQINEAVGRSLLVVGAPTLVTAKDLSDGVLGVFFTDLPGSTAGTAWISWTVDGSGRPGHIVAGDVGLDPGLFERMGTTERVGVMVHELGHLLGLAHVGDAHEALSNGFVNDGDVGVGTRTVLRELYAVACGNHPRVADGPIDWRLPAYRGRAASVRTWNVGESARNVVELGVAVAGSHTGERGPAWASRAVICRDDDFADCLTGAPLAGGSGPVLFVPGGPSGQLPSAVVSMLSQSLRHGARVFVLGGDQAVSGTIESGLGARWDTVRVGGQNRIETAALVADRVVALNGRRGVALIARDDNPADAVTGGAAAGARGVPILLAQRQALPTDTSAALDRLGITRTVLLGGPAALEPRVEDALRQQGRAPSRAAGDNRTQTSVAIAQDPQLWDRTTIGSKTAFVGLNGWHDETWALALAAAPLAVHLQAPILLTRPDDVPLGVGSVPEPAWYLAHLDNPDGGGVAVTYVFVGAGRWADRHAAESFRSYLFVGR